MKRQVSFSTLIGLIKKKQPYATIAFIFIIISIIFLPFISLFWVAFKGENSNYNFNNIEKYGSQKEAKITYIKTVENLTINNEHPVIISYEYENNGNIVKDKFETLDLESIANFDTGTKIKVLAYNNQSMIKGVGVYGFPTQLFYLIPGFFFVAGVILLLITLIPALKLYNLYKTGIIKNAVLVSADTSNGINSLSSFKRLMAVNYYFMNDHQNKVFGECKSTDFLFLMGKKAGDTIKIFVSEKDETNSCLIPALEAAKNNWQI